MDGFALYFPGFNPHPKKSTFEKPFLGTKKVFANPTVTFVMDSEPSRAARSDVTGGETKALSS